MSSFVRGFGYYLLKVLGLGCLALLLACPTLAQEQTKKKEPAPQVEKAPCQEKLRTMSPEMKEAPAEAMKPQEELQMKKSVDRKFGGQEIRAKEGEEEKK
jgi:hypothetical protein